MRMREVGKMGKMDTWEKDYGSASKMNCKMRFRDDAFLRGILWQERVVVPHSNGIKKIQRRPLSSNFVSTTRYCDRSQPDSAVL